MTCARENTIGEMNIYGHLRLAIEQMKGSRAKMSISLRVFSQHTRELKAPFYAIHFDQVYKGYDQDVDEFSKQPCART